MKITKQDIIDAAVDIVRQGGEQALNTRAVAAKLGCSTQPIFSNYSSVGQLKEDVLKAADERFRYYMKREIDLGKYPEYKAAGIGYIKYAKEEKELFKLQFMRKRPKNNQKPQKDWEENEWNGMVDMVRKNVGFDEKRAGLFHLEMWVIVHGIAVMLATEYLDWDDELISQVLTDLFEGLRAKHYNKEAEKDEND